MQKVLFVCHGNICRSPMAEFLLRDIAEKQGLPIGVASAATSTEELGNPVHRGTAQKLQSVGILTNGKRARQLTRSDYEEYDWLLGMDSANLRNMHRILGGDPDGKIYRLLDFSNEPRDIADPWYTDNFDATYDDIIEGIHAFLIHIKMVK